MSIGKVSIGIFGMLPVALMQDTEARRHGLVYAALASFQGGNPDCWPSFEGIAERAGCKRRQAIYSVKELCRLGWIQRVSHGGSAKDGTREANHYCVSFPVVKTEPVPMDSFPEDTGDCTSAMECTSTSAIECTSTSAMECTLKEQEKEQENNSSRERAASSPSFIESIRAAGLVLPPADCLTLENSLRASGIEEPALYAAWLRVHVESRNPKNPPAFFRQAIYNYTDLRDRYIAGDPPRPKTEEELAAEQAEHRRHLARQYQPGYTPEPPEEVEHPIEDDSAHEILVKAAAAGNPAAMAVLGMLGKTA